MIIFQKKYPQNHQIHLLPHFLAFPAHLAIKIESGPYFYPYIALTTRPETYSVPFYVHFTLEFSLKMALYRTSMHNLEQPL